MKKSLVAVVAAMATAMCYAGTDDVSAIPWIRDSGRDVYKEKFLSGINHKAFAISKTGQYGWSTSRESSGKAAQFALYNCLKVSSARCVLYAVDDKVVLDEYRAATDFGGLKPPAKATYADEDNDAGVAPISGLKSGKLHEPTPTSAPFAKTLTTAALIELLSAASKPIVLDVLQPTETFRKNAVPSALWISGAGVYDGKANERIDDLLAKFMADVSPAKDAPVVVYCLSWECWLSYNALYRLSKLGYTNLYWYRGGMVSWQRAGLPTIEVPLAAQVY